MKNKNSKTIVLNESDIDDEIRYKIKKIDSLKEKVKDEGFSACIYGFFAAFSVLGMYVNYQELSKEPYSVTRFIVLMMLIVSCGLSTKEMIASANRQTNAENQKSNLYQELELFAIKKQFEEKQSKKS